MPAGGVWFTCAGMPVYTNEKYAGRKGCGFDLTPLILSQPKDGTVRNLTCPACGNIFRSMRPAHPVVA